MRKILYSTVCYPVMNLALNLIKQAEAKDTDEYRKFAAQQESLRYKAIFNGRPYQPMFS